MTRTKVSRVGLTLSLLLVSLMPAVATASQSAKLNVALKPERLGGRTTIIFTFHIITHHQPVPTPVVGVSLFYPANIGLVTSGLGLETCAPAQLETQGRCPPNSLMGYGSALVELPFGADIIQEEGHITTWMAPIQNGQLALLFYAEAPTPVSAELIFTGRLLPAPAPYGGQLTTSIPVIRTLPEAPDASVVRLTATIGPMNITYYAWFRGKRIPYHPNGLQLPETCSRGGFPFAATFTFIDGTQATARTAVPCPASSRTRLSRGK